MSVCLSDFLYVCMSVCLSDCLSVCMYVSAKTMSCTDKQILYNICVCMCVCNAYDYNMSCLDQSSLSNAI